LNQFRGAQLAAIQNTSLADIISRNTTTTNLQDNVFFFKTSVSGRVTTGDPRRLMGVSGITIELHDSTGAVVATTTTDSSGAYRFSQVGLGSYTVTEVKSKGTAATKTVLLTKGEDVTNINFVDSTVSTPVAGGSRDHFPGPRGRV
jgi:peroxidase